MKTYPSWMALSVPPLVIIVLVVNLLMAFISSLIVTFSKKQKVEEILKHVVRKTINYFLIEILLEVIIVIFYFIPELFNSNKFIKENIILNLENNPYTNIYSIIYMILVLLINIIIVLLFSKKEKVYTKVLLIILLIPYIYFIPSNKIIKTKFKTLDDYRNTTIENNEKIKTILSKLEIGEYISSYTMQKEYPYIIKIYIENLDFDYQIMFEKDASILLNLITETKQVVFAKDGKDYIYKIDDINSIFKDIKKLNIKEIEKRYEDSNFSDYTYLGRIKEYDIFDTSETCELEHQLLFEYNDIKYYLSCSKLEKILLYGNNKNINIKEALNKNIISYEDIIESNIDLIEE